MNKSKFSFGEFTFDPDTGTLTRRNRDQRLPEQTARLLAILLERANNLVTREELRQVLWPNEEFLDYDQGINVAINRLRTALREGSRDTQFLKTIPKRGYSFSGRVTLIPRDTASPGIISPSAAKIALSGNPPDETSEAQRPALHESAVFSSTPAPAELPARSNRRLSYQMPT